jgi:hypothetical protein
MESVQSVVSEIVALDHNPVRRLPRSTFSNCGTGPPDVARNGDGTPKRPAAFRYVSRLRGG